MVGLADVALLSAGSTHSLAVKSDGSVWAWGSNQFGQLADNTTTDRATPGLIPALPAIRAISTSGWHTVAVGADGSVWSWGRNTHGQVGDLTLENRLTAMQAAQDGTLEAVEMETPGTLDPGNDRVRYYHTDAIGSVRVITDDSGGVVERFDFKPFGEEWVAGASLEPRRFTGHERDGEIELDYLGARIYVPRTGSFTSVDPALDVDSSLTDPQRWNRYSYASSAPLRFTDPDGRVIFDWADFKRNVTLMSKFGESGYDYWLPTVAGIAAVGSVAQDALVIAVSAEVAAAYYLPKALAFVAPSAALATSVATKLNSTQAGELIGWGASNKPDQVAQTLRVSQELTRGRVADLARAGLERGWVETQLRLYELAKLDPKKLAGNTQLLPRLELMKTILKVLARGVMDTPSLTLLNHWRQQPAIAVMPPAPAADIVEFERRYSVSLPAELIDYYRVANGFDASGDQDDRGFSFWPLDRVSPIETFDVNVGWFAPGAEGSFIFADYLSLCWAYAFRLIPHSESAAVCIVGTADGKAQWIARSFSEFCDLYIQDDPRLYPKK